MRISLLSILLLFTLRVFAGVPVVSQEAQTLGYGTSTLLHATDHLPFHDSNPGMESFVELEESDDDDTSKKDFQPISTLILGSSWGDSFFHFSLPLASITDQSVRYITNPRFLVLRNIRI